MSVIRYIVWILALLIGSFILYQQLFDTRYERWDKDALIGLKSKDIIFFLGMPDENNSKKNYMIWFDYNNQKSLIIFFDKNIVYDVKIQQFKE